MQIIRFIGLILNFIVFCMTFFIFVKKVLIYFHCWALFVALLAQGFLFVASGSQVVEGKLRERGDAIAEKDKSSLWKYGIFLYTLALPMVIIANILFFVMVFEDLQYSTEFDFGHGKWGWRNVFLWLAHLVPLVTLSLDFFLNSLLLPYSAALFNFLLMVLYVAGTCVGQLVQKSKAVYTSHLNWFLHHAWSASTCIAEVSSASGNLPSDYVVVNMCPAPNWKNNMVTLSVVVFGCLAAHFVVVLLSNVKSRLYIGNITDCSAANKASNGNEVGEGENDNLLVTSKSQSQAKTPSPNLL